MQESIASIIVAIVTGIFTLAGVIATVVSANKKTQAQIKASSDVTLYRIEQLEKKQDKHNGLVERMYIAEENIKIHDVKIAELEKRHEEK
jgi:type IV secretory pathway protease TraF